MWNSEADSPIVRVISSIAIALLASVSLPTEASEPDRNGDSYFKPGGAVRFNYGWLDYGPTSRLQLELMRADLDAGTGPFSFSAQYRWYDGFDAVHHAYAGWQFSDATQLKAGIQQVPFGLLPTVSQSFWFGSGYYLGIEDDYDPGLVVIHRSGSTTWHLGWFSGDEYGSGARYDRYSFDVAQTEALPYREQQRLHARVESARDWGGGELLLGASAFAGKVQNTQTRRQYGHQGAALHAQWQRDGWTAQLQWARYRYDVPGDRIAMSAFESPFQVAAQADVPSANIAYSFGQKGWLDDITCYNNLSMTRPVGHRAGLRDSWQNVTGCSLQKGIMLTYVDWIAGRNMWFAGGDGIGIDEGGPSRWHSRLNFNIGFYF
ncbi:hypothetical protein LBG_09560 [Stenotrophomonas maltophilia]|uniref:hypothetical protein n=1 Tax=Stenotrophomonas maltophilia TaxID=40324 RepID=UPI0010562ACE|nr:hypothetical protein [Stenotrophomonas maltophilia]QBL44812.1 hypothetical protein LBG_09560 [Stenotrophomonas maltophilia]